MKIIFLACQQIGVDSIKSAINGGFEIPFVYTYELPLDPLYGYASVAAFCQENTIPFSSSIKSDFSEIKKINPDWIISVYYRKIIPIHVLKYAKHGAVNLHPSMLPFYRGPVPTVWALLNGERQTGVTLHYMDSGIDTGQVIFQKKIIISDYDTGFSLYKKCMKDGLFVVNSFLKRLSKRKKIPKKPQPKGGSYFGKLPPYITNLNWKEKSAEILRRIRAFTKPYGGCETKLMNKRFVIWKAVNYQSKKYKIGPPGKILKKEKNDKIVVSTADGLIKIVSYDCLPLMSKKEKSVYLRPGNYFDDQ